MSESRGRWCGNRPALQPRGAIVAIHSGWVVVVSATGATYAHDQLLAESPVLEPDEEELAGFAGEEDEDTEAEEDFSAGLDSVVPLPPLSFFAACL